MNFSSFRVKFKCKYYCFSESIAFSEMKIKDHLFEFSYELQMHDFCKFYLEYPLIT
eukprot:UN21623